MNKEKNPTVIAAWVTGGLGCAGVILLVIGSIVAAFIQRNRSEPPQLVSTIVVVMPTASTGGPNSPPTIPPTTLRVINDTSGEICHVYIVQTGSESWGENWLKTTGPITPNEATIFTVKTGMYHLRAEDCDHKTLAESLDNHIEGDMHWVVENTSTDSTETVLEVINNGTDSICNLYISPSSDEDWGSDWLDASETIPAGGSLVFTLETGMYDLLVEDCGNEEITESLDNHLQGRMEWTIE